MLRRSLAIMVCGGLLWIGPAAAQPADTRAATSAIPYADIVNVYHTPLRPTDGPVASSWLRTMGSLEPVALRKGVPDLRSEMVTNERVGNVIITTSLSIGTLIDGDKLRSRTTVVREIRDGKVVAIHSAGDPDPKMQAIYSKAMKLGGLVAPPRPPIK